MMTSADTSQPTVHRVYFHDLSTGKYYRAERLQESGSNFFLERYSSALSEGGYSWRYLGRVTANTSLSILEALDMECSCKDESLFRDSFTSEQWEQLCWIF